MRAISLWQPWASAIAVGVKKVETRHWKTDYRGPIAIHAAKRWDRHQREFAEIEYALGRLPARLPFGALVAVATIKDCRPTEELEQEVGAIERLYGNFEPGRYGWILTDVRALPEPVPVTGRQGIFRVADALVQVD